MHYRNVAIIDTSRRDIPTNHLGNKIMKANKHIQALAKEHDLGEHYMELMQALWNGRDKSRFVTTCLMSVSSSGMTRAFKVGFVHKGVFTDITFLVAKITGNKWDRNNGTVKIGGCGMDMAFALVNALYCYLAPNNFKGSASGLSAAQRYNDF